jgi:hypothetical protein
MGTDVNGPLRISPLPGAYPIEMWRASYLCVDALGRLTAHQAILDVPRGLGDACLPVQLGQAGCVYGVRRWGVILRPSALEHAAFDPAGFLPSDAEDEDWVRATLDAVTFELPGGLILASPAHPFRLFGANGRLRGSSVTERSYLGALAFYLSKGVVDASFVSLMVEAPESYRQAVAFALEALQAAAAAF